MKIENELSLFVSRNGHLTAA